MTWLYVGGQAPKTRRQAWLVRCRGEPGVGLSVHEYVCWLGLGEIMLGVCALGDRERVISNNPTTDDNTSLGLDIYIISKIAHPSNTKPHHRKFQIPRRPPP